MLVIKLWHFAPSKVLLLRVSKKGCSHSWGKKKRREKKKPNQFHTLGCVVLETNSSVLKLPFGWRWFYINPFVFFSRPPKHKGADQKHFSDTVAPTRAKTDDGVITSMLTALAKKTKTLKMSAWNETPATKYRRSAAIQKAGKLKKKRGLSLVRNPPRKFSSQKRFIVIAVRIAPVPNLVVVNVMKWILINMCPT